jgi:hypothetical protein
MLEPDPAISDEFVIELEGEAVGKVGFYRLPEPPSRFAQSEAPSTSSIPEQATTRGREATHARIVVTMTRSVPRVDADRAGRNMPDARLVLGSEVRHPNYTSRSALRCGLVASLSRLGAHRHFRRHLPATATVSSGPRPQSR